ncbi:PREDICTED: borealin isoform X1 [Poecilia mexicana]|uniref:borealin isoform X1 n=1 Tax=Poecilia mexicana TaxID=48701 RepID=UPI00072EA948|nr:PREDICTED: borealin isoform X1 [Poecilia mexicana]
MAPRKRTTKQRKNSPKTAKLEAFLEDFDSEVKTRVGQMRERINQLLKDVDNSYNMALIKLPRAVRQMNWLQLCGDPDKSNAAEVDDVKRREEAAILESVVAEDHAVLLKSVKKTTRKKGGAKSGCNENVLNSTRKTRTARKPPSTTKRSKVLDVSKEGSTIRRSNRKPLVTPARNLLDSSLMMGPTPLITPRFDPRLPKTPAVRVPRHKERVFSMSVNGSPIEAGSDIVINVPVGNGESIQLLASEMDSLDLTLLDESALRSIRLLKNRLTTLCGPSE